MQGLSYRTLSLNTFNRFSVEGLELVSLDRRLVLVEMGEWILCTIVVRIVVRIDCLRFKACDCVKLLDRCCAEPGQCTEHSALDLRYLRVFHGINQGVLRLGRVILELFGCVLFSEWSNLIEVHFKIMGHLFGQLVLRGPEGRSCCDGSHSNDKHFAQHRKILVCLKLRISGKGNFEV